MKNRHCVIAQWIPAGLLFMSGLSGCSAPGWHPASASRDHAFIAYWPPAENTGKLRLAVKDLIDMKGVVTTAGSEYVARTNPPAARDAKCLGLARARKVQIVGKTNLGELAVRVSGMNEYFGTPKNHVSDKRKLIPGGSSSGSAVAVASGLADVSFGTDTAGSIRVPAACCGILGLKTTFGLVPLKGVFPLSPAHLDTVGPMARDIPHLVRGMDLLQNGFAGRYANAVAAKPSSKSIRIGRLYVGGTDPAIDKAVDVALAAKHFQVTVLGPAFKAEWDKAQRAGQTVAIADTWLNERKYGDKKGVRVTTKAVIKLGELAYKSRYADALKSQAEWRHALRQLFKKVDFIALPTLQALPPKVPFFGGSPLFEARALAMENTAAVNFAGNPALAIPIPLEDKTVPVTSLQLVGPRLSEAELLNAGRLIESKP